MPDDTRTQLHDSDGPLPDNAPLPSAAGRYVLGEEIARGGMGAVHRATDSALSREVAVKVLLDRYAPASAASRRFADEARITGQLQHPGIPPVHDLGILPDGRPFLAMKLIKGDTLEELLKARPDPSADHGRFVAIFEKVCEAVAYAHAHDVVHRDLKPANIMVGAFGEVQVMDWGLAKVVGERPAAPADDGATTAGTAVVSIRDSDGSFTQAGSVLGTPAFMPPEQAVGAMHKVGPHSDVFGLGAVLAVILTGKPPFTASSGDTARLRAATGDVADCFNLLDGCGADSELIALCKRSLSPRPEDRPADAGAVALAVAGLRHAAEERARQAELDRVKAEGEQKAAAMKSAEQRKRRRVQFELAAAMLGLLVAAGFGATVAVMWQRAEGARDEAELQKGHADERRAEADVQRGEAEVQRREADTQRLKARQYLYYSRVGLAARAWDDGQVHLAGELLRQDRTQPPGEDLRGFEWHYLWRLHAAPRRELRGHTDNIAGVAWSPDGRRLATGSRDMTVRLWNADGTVPTVHVLAGHTGTVEQVAWSPSGDLLATASIDRTARIWDAETGRLIKTLTGQISAIQGVAWSPDGDRLATAGWDGTVWVWDTRTWTTLFVYRGHSTIVYGVAFSPDGQNLASVGHSPIIHICDATTGKLRHTLFGHTAAVFRVAWSPDGSTLATASHDGTVRLWESETGRPLREMKGHTNKVYGVAWSPDGSVVASTGVDGTVRLWRAATGQELRVFRGHTGRVTAAAFRPDGKVLATSSYDKTVRFWDADIDQDSMPLRGHIHWVWGVAFSPDSRTLVTASGDSTIRVWNLGTGQTRAILSGAAKSEMRTVAHSPDGRLIAGGSADAAVTVWDATSGQPVHNLGRLRGSAVRVAFSPDGRHFVAASGTLWYADLAYRAVPAVVKVWRVGDWQEVATLTGHSGGVTDLSFSPDSARLATASFDGSVRVFDVATGVVTRSIKWAESWPSAVAFHPDGTRLATGSPDGTLQLWDIGSGRELRRFHGHTEDVMGIAFSPDGTRLVSGSHDSLVKLWDPVLGHELMTLRGRGLSPVMAVAFSPDGRRLAAGYQDATARVWDATPHSTGK